MQKFLLTLSLVQGAFAFVFENDNLNHLDIEFSSSHSILDRVARDFDDESSGDDEISVRAGSVDPSDIPKTVATSADITAIQEVVVTEILQDSTTKVLNASTPAPVGDDETTTKAANTTTPTTPAPEPTPENGSALTLFGWTTTLLLATITALLL